MNPREIYKKLKQNKEVFQHLFENISEEEYKWSQKPGKWCLLEILCHLYDEEREDFRTRVQCVLEDPDTPPPTFDPLIWIKERNYIGQNYNSVLVKFLEERDKSVNWLNTLKDPQWDNTFHHPKLGPMSAYLFLSNWLAHDYLHIRQIIRLKIDYLKVMSNESLTYAGDW